MNNEENIKESDFHKGAGHKIPHFVRFVWTILVIWGLYYLFKYSLPDLKLWLLK